MPRRTALALALIALLALPAAAPAAPRVPSGFFGVGADGPLDTDLARFDAEWDLMRSNRVRLARVAFYWRVAQPQPGAFDLSATDAVVLAAARRGITVLPVVLGTPDWAAIDPGNAGSPPRRAEDYAAYARALAERYGPGGTLWQEQPYLPPRPIRRWQVWNEPSLATYWSRQPFARAYVRLLRVTRRELRRADPRARVILAGLPNRSWLALRKIYRAGGRGTFDAVALHPYTGDVRNLLKIIGWNRDEMRRARDARRALWLTEVSWPASRGRTGRRPNGFEVTERIQARRLGQAFEALARRRARLRLEGVVWYTWISTEGAATPRWSGYSGLRRLRGDRVVSARSLAAFRRSLGRLQR